MYFNKYNMYLNNYNMVYNTNSLSWAFLLALIDFQIVYIFYMLQKDL